MKYASCLLIFIIFIFSSFIHAFDNPHFYRAPNIFPEPRIEHDYLTTFDISISEGRSQKSRNFDRESVPLLDIFGTHSMQQLGVNLPEKDLNDLDLILTQLSLLPSRENFATFSIKGKFSIVELNLSFAQNFKHGFFFLFHLPVRRLKIDDIVFNDLSPDNQIFPNKNTLEWQRFLQFFDPILTRHNLSRKPFNTTAVGDLTSWIGWTHNYQETEILDFVDASFMAGFLAPTGKKRNENEIFSLPHGYNGHWGVPFASMVSVGLYEWVTVGGYLNAIFFADKTRCIRLKTAEQQRGLIKLAQGKVKIDKGTVWHTGLYFKADHFVRGLSFMFAYSFAAQREDTLCPDNNTLFDFGIINSDEMLRGWKMHTIHFLLEYDFTKEHSKVGTRIGVFYNRHVSGKRTFKTNTGGGMIGLDIGWDL